MVDVTFFSLLSVLGRSVPIQNPSPESLQCEGPLPLYLREPYSVPLHDSGLDYGIRSDPSSYLLKDSTDFRMEWTEKFNETRHSDQPLSDEPPPPADHPPLLADDPETVPDEDDFKKNWNFHPNDLSFSINNDQIVVSFKDGSRQFEKTLRLEKKLRDKHLSHEKMSASDRHQRVFRRRHHLAELYSFLGYIMGWSTVFLLQSIDQPGYAQHVVAIELQFLGPVKVCEDMDSRPQVGSCDRSAPYRTFDGTCNNVLNPDWGSAFIPLRRIVPPYYEDGVMSLRLAKDGTKLPSARLISYTINSLKSRSIASCFSFLHLTFGQFLDHDITSTPVIQGVNGSTIPCCIEDVVNKPKLFHHECEPILIPPDDPHYATWGVTCMEFIRSLPAGRCLYGPREQVNQITGFIDGSNIYGSTEEDSSKLREGEGGRLLMLDHDGESFLQPSLDPDDGCNTEEKIEQEEYCFISGDDRVNEQVILALMHTIWSREHNRVAKQLQALNPDWSDEQLFQEARRIVVAEMQHIVYNEFLPGVLGKTFMARLDMLPQKDGRKTNNYDPNIDPSISNEFATAAFRFGHSGLPDNVHQMSKNGKTSAKPLNDVLFSPFDIYSEGSPERLMRGSTFQHAMNVDYLFTNQVAGMLFRGHSQIGLDLVALNIQRGRDHGLGTYTTVREACGLSRVTTFSDLEPFLEPGAVPLLQKVYSSVEDIDLFVGGVSEIALEGGQVGPTFACIMADQFLRLKNADRFWYEEDGPGAFTQDQLRELHGVSMARIICDNVRDTHNITRWPMQVPSAFNPLIPCDSDCIPSIDFSSWEDDE